jgi:hypothetical protein
MFPVNHILLVSWSVGTLVIIFYWNVDIFVFTLDSSNFRRPQVYSSLKSFSMLDKNLTIHTKQYCSESWHKRFMKVPRIIDSW